MTWTRAVLGRCSIILSPIYWDHACTWFGIYICCSSCSILLYYIPYLPTFLPRCLPLSSSMCLQLAVLPSPSIIPSLSALHFCMHSFAGMSVSSNSSPSLFSTYSLTFFFFSLLSSHWIISMWHLLFSTCHGFLDPDRFGYLIRVLI